MLRRPIPSAGTIAALAGAVLLASVALADKKSVPVLMTWEGKSDSDTLQAAAPANEFIADQESWKKLWKAWRGDDELPKVDFQNEFILAAATSGPNSVNISARLDDKGNLEVLAAATMMAGPGFGYAIVKIPRAGIKTVDGHPVPGNVPARQPDGK